MPCEVFGSVQEEGIGTQTFLREAKVNGGPKGCPRRFKGVTKGFLNVKEQNIYKEKQIRDK